MKKYNLEDRLIKFAVLTISISDKMNNTTSYKLPDQLSDQVRR